MQEVVWCGGTCAVLAIHRIRRTAFSVRKTYGMTDHGLALAIRIGYPQNPSPMSIPKPPHPPAPMLALHRTPW